MTDVGDGWGAPYDDQTYVNAYDQLEIALLEPLDRVLPLANLEEFRPKFKNQQKPRQKKKGNSGDTEWKDAIRLANKFLPILNAQL
ncbi:hypothetical protein B9Z55_010399 [Caenorhabditis nigoni]|uniref:Uncharacterized protein n=1 Tax=Caenorhabditis nigoni TaxID=1611254 RepID=A0A2G5UFN5_9PELO|nr:hypothetical protein B9Z55_010399 [Caenorhabditis nigoni]